MLKNLAMFNIIQMAKGKARWTMISDDTWDMILGKKLDGCQEDWLLRLKS